jgi:hypothetical protein
VVSGVMAFGIGFGEIDVKKREKINFLGRRR